MQIKFPKFTVVVISHSRKEFILSALESVVNQSYDSDNIEIIVVKNFQDPVIDKFISDNRGKNIIVSDKSFGVKIATGIESSNSDFIAFLDDDDTWAKDKLSKVAEYFMDPEVCYYHNNQLFVDKNGEPIGQENELKEVSKMVKAGLLRLNKESPKSLVGEIYQVNPDFNLSSMVFRKSAIIEHIGLIRDFDTALDTLLFYLSLATGHDIILDPERLTYYRKHDANVSSLSMDVVVGNHDRSSDFSHRRSNAFCSMYEIFRNRIDIRVANLIRPICSGLKILDMVIGDGKGRFAMLKSLLDYLIHSPFKLLSFRKDFTFYGMVYVISPSYSKTVYRLRH